jgi:hypothetical protein
MDRCHRIGQQKPVLVFRLATGHSVEGRMLKRAADKMALERVVIKKGAFIDVQEAQAKVGGVCYTGSRKSGGRCSSYATTWLAGC